MAFWLTLDIIAVVLACVATGFAWAFVISYRKDNWRSTSGGHYLMNLTIGMAVIMSWAVSVFLLRLVFGTPTWFLVFVGVGRIVVYGWVAWKLCQQLMLLRAVHRSRRKGLTP